MCIESLDLRYAVSLIGVDGEGTALTMRSQVLRDAFTAKGINASAPTGNNHRQAVLALIATLQHGDSDGEYTYCDHYALGVRYLIDLTSIIILLLNGVNAKNATRIAVYLGFPTTNQAIWSV